MNNTWFKNILNQKFQNGTFSDPTFIFIVLAFSDKKLEESYSVRDIATIVYRYYIANEVSKKNFSIVIRNIERYGIDDILPIIEDALKNWNTIGSTVTLNGSIVNLDIDSYSEETRKLSFSLGVTLYEKYFGERLKFPFDFGTITNIDDNDTSSFGNSKFKQLIFEDLQFCPLTETVKFDDLRVVRIYPMREGATDEDLTTKDNLLLLQSDIANDYNNGLFCFDEFGRVINIKTNRVSSRMRLGVKYLSSERKKYIRKHLEHIQ